MYCSKCGQLISAGSTYCNFCGQPVSNVESIGLAQKGDFITLKCPNCGGNLEINTQGQTFKCPFCGFEHILRRDQNGFFLEAYARCPTCHRNDKVAKARLLFGDPSEPGLYIQPLKLDHLVTRMIVGTIFFIFLFFFLDYLLSHIGTKYVVWPFYCLGGLVIFCYFTLIRNYMSNVKIQQRNDEARRKFEEERLFVENFRKEWELVYYCSRDGTYFNFKTGQSLSKETLNQIKPFLTGRGDQSSFLSGQ